MRCRNQLLPWRWIVYLLVLLWAGHVLGQDSATLQQIGIDPQPNAQLPLDLTFRDETGREVKLGEYFQDQPVILNLAYFRCPMLCSMTRDGLIKTLRTMELQAGSDFTILTISFDPHEGPKLAAEAKRTAIANYDRIGADQGWHFLTGDQEAIRQLTDSLGYRFLWDESTGRFAHSATLVVMSPDGRVSRYLNGVEFAARDVELALVEAADGRIGTVTDQALLFCYQYDPTTGRYGLAIMQALRVGGAVTVLGLAIGITALWRRERRTCVNESEDCSLPK